MNNYGIKNWTLDAPNRAVICATEEFMDWETSILTTIRT